MAVPMTLPEKASPIRGPAGLRCCWLQKWVRNASLRNPPPEPKRKANAQSAATKSGGCDAETDWVGASRRDVVRRYGWGLGRLEAIEGGGARRHRRPGWRHGSVRPRGSGDRDQVRTAWPAGGRRQQGRGQRRRRLRLCQTVRG